MARPTKAIYRDDDDRPRRKADKPEGVPVWIVAMISGVALFLLVAVALGAWFFLSKEPARPVQAPEPAPPINNPTPPARKVPTGWTDVRDTEGGYQVFLPGTVTKGQPQLGGPLPAGVQMTLFAGSTDRITVAARSIKPAGPIPAGTTPEQMLGWLPHWNLGVDPKTGDVESRTPLTFGGKPGLLVRAKERRKDYAKLMQPAGGKEIEVPKDEFADAFQLLKDLQQATESARQQALKDLQDKENQRALQHELYFITSNGQRVIVIQLKSASEYPNEATLTTLTSSFEFVN